MLKRIDGLVDGRSLNRTGRVCQMNVRARPETIKMAQSLSSDLGLSIGRVIELALHCLAAEVRAIDAKRENDGDSPTWDWLVD